MLTSKRRVLVQNVEYYFIVSGSERAYRQVIIILFHLQFCKCWRLRSYMSVLGESHLQFA